VNKKTAKWLEELRQTPEYIAEGMALDLTFECERRREQLEMSYADVARAMGVSRQHVHKLFSGTQNSTIGSLVKLALALGCELNISLGKPIPSAKVTPAVKQSAKSRKSPSSSKRKGAQPVQ